MISNNKQQTTNNKIFFKFIFSLLFVFCFLFFVRQSQAAAEFPISQLGSCRDAQECKLYCDVPAHTPACWSYDKYVLNINVLGDATVNISYPIADLGGCATAEQCFIYCSQPENQSSCLTYAKNNGLIKDETTNPESTPPAEIIEAAKTELGCTDKDSCMALCNSSENMDKCRNFAQKHGLNRNESHQPPPEVLANAKAELGCESESTCRNFCEIPENRDKCFAFAKKNNLIKPEEVREIENHMEQKAKMIETAKSELGCDSEISCSKFCADPNYREKCMNLGRKFGMVKEDNRPDRINDRGQKPILPCTGESECRKYCESHPDDCHGFSSQPNKSTSENTILKPTGNLYQPESIQKNQPDSMQKKSDNSTGNFLGPGGCKNESECKAYCEKHSTECPGFPKDRKPVLNPASSSSTRITPTTAEFPPNCSTNEECRARYCQKYPARCTTVSPTYAVKISQVPMVTSTSSRADQYQTPTLVISPYPTGNNSSSDVLPTPTQSL